MTKNTANIDRLFDDFERFVTRDVPNIVAETATEYYHERFIEKNWDGKPWPKYNPYNNPKRNEPTKGSLLLRTTNLRRSVRPSLVRPDLVRISAGSSKVPYARAHNEGFNGFQQVPGYVNSNFMGKGQSVRIRGHRRYQRLPRRQFIGRSEIVNQNIKSRLIAELNNRRR